MSIKVMSHIWEKSKQRGSALLMLLAIADNANDQGEAWPSVETLAKKTRMSERNAQYIIRKLEEAKELAVQERDGSSSLYTIPVPWRTKKIKTRRKQQGVKAASGVQPASPPGAKAFTPGVQPASPPGVQPASPKPSIESSLNPFAPDGASPSEQTLEDDLVNTVPDFYPCDAKDIAALIAIWYDWIPRRPSRRGAIIPLQEHLQNTTNREYAENLHRRGVRPGDFAQCLGEMRLKPPDAGWKEMTFSYAAKIVEAWVEADRRENVYTLDCPRIVARRPDALVQLGDPDSADFFERLAANPNVMVYVPPPYISPHDVEPPPEENTVPIAEEDLSPERWAKEGMPL